MRQDYPKFSPTEEAELLTRARNGNRDAHDQLILSGYPMIKSLAHKYSRMGLDFDDLVSEGTIGLIRALEKFEPKRARFLSYAWFWIRWAMLRAIQYKADLVHVPIHKKEKIEVVSLDDPGCGDESFYNVLCAKVPTESNCIEEIAHLFESAEFLSARERLIIELHYGMNGADPKQFTEIGAQLGIDECRVWQIHKAVLGKIRTRRILELVNGR